jgi:23S rRNA C2498 (ribose-2'-O)-methylase RlmM
MKLIAPLVLVTWLLSDYSLCHQRADIAWDLLIAAINKPVALVTTVRKVRVTGFTATKKSTGFAVYRCYQQARRSCHHSTQGTQFTGFTGTKKSTAFAVYRCNQQQKPGALGCLIH